MAYQTPQVREFVVSTLGEIGCTIKGNAYLECNTDLGVVAFWGKGSMANITRLQQATTPVRVRCGVITSYWPQHRLWIPESSRVEVLQEGASATASSATSSASPRPAQSTKPSSLGGDELNQWR